MATCLYCSSPCDYTGATTSKGCTNSNCKAYAPSGSHTSCHSSFQKTSDLSGTKEIVFFIGPDRILELASNGDIYVKGRLVQNDQEVVDGMREFLRDCGYIR